MDENDVVDIQLDSSGSSGLLAAPSPIYAINTTMSSTRMTNYLLLVCIFFLIMIMCFRGRS